MHVLTRAKKVKADNSEWQLIKMNPSQIDILQKLELLEKPAQKKRGRKSVPRISILNFCTEPAVFY